MTVWLHKSTWICKRRRKWRRIWRGVRCI